MVVDWLERISANSLEDFPLKVKYFADSVCWLVVLIDHFTMGNN